MKTYKLTEMEGKLSDLIWANEPIPSGELVKLCKKRFDWKKSTTYTMLKRLENKGIFQNRNVLVSSLIKKDDFYAKQCKQFVKENFEGSLPKFLAAFTRNTKLSDDEISALLKLIHEHKEG